jgi:hypothetical protein
MKRMAYVITGLCIGLFLMPQAVMAGPIIRSGDLVSVDAGQALKGDFYGLGSTVTLSGPAEHDAYLGGGTVTVNGPVAEDLVIAGGSAQVHSEIADDLRVIGGEATLGGEVKGDVVVVGGTFTVLSTAHVDGDILFFGGTLIVEGDVDGTIHGYAQTARINAAVGGDVMMTTAHALILSDRAHVMGNVSYTSANELSRAQGAVIEGEVQRSDIASSSSEGSATGLIFAALSLLFLAASFFVLARSKVEWLVREAYVRPGQNGLIGLAIFLVMPFAAFILCVSIVGIPLGILVFAGYIASLMVSIGLAALFLGYAIERLVFKRDCMKPATLAIGVCATIVLVMLPFVGFFTVWALGLISIGTMGVRIARWLRP